MAAQSMSAGRPQLGDLRFLVGFVVAAAVYFALAARLATQAAAAATALL